MINHVCTYRVFGGIYSRLPYDEQAGHRLVICSELLRLEHMIAMFTFLEVRRGNAGLKLQQLSGELSTWFTCLTPYLLCSDLIALNEWWDVWTKELNASGYPLMAELEKMWRQLWCTHPMLLNILLDNSGEEE